MGNYYGEPAPYSGDTTTAKVICTGVKAALALMGIATAIGIPAMVILNAIAL